MSVGCRPVLGKSVQLNEQVVLLSCHNDFSPPNSNCIECWKCHVEMVASDREVGLICVLFLELEWKNSVVLNDGVCEKMCYN